MGVNNSYLGAHKSGNKENYPLFNHLLHTISIMTNFQCRHSQEDAGDTT